MSYSIKYSVAMKNRPGAVGVDFETLKKLKARRGVEAFDET